MLMLSSSFLPITGFAAEVHDGDDENEISLDGVENAVRKNVRDAAAHILVDYTSAGGRLQHSIDRGLNGFNKS